MTFSLPDRWVWDAWYVHDTDKTHMFFLNAPKAIGNPDHRHFYAWIGHATSEDLRHWTYRGTALAPSAGPAWDDLAVWTGSVIRRTDGRWMLFYTGISRAERGHVQRIGAALSDDLIHWTRFGTSPLVQAEPAHYETLASGDARDEACRDPFVFADPDGKGWHMYFTARRFTGPDKERGVIGHATSPDLEHWTVRPPIWIGDAYAELEVPDMFASHGRHYLLFSTAGGMISESHQARRGTPRETGTHYLVSDNGPLGPWQHVKGAFLLGDPIGTRYVARHVRLPDGQHALIAFENMAADGSFGGTLTDPLPLTIDAGGGLQVQFTEDRKEGVAAWER